MKTVIEARRIECKSIDFKVSQEIWDNMQGYDLVNYLTVNESYYLASKKKKEKGELFRKLQIPQILGFYKCRQGKLWLIHCYNYTYYSEYSDIFHKLYGMIRVQKILKYFNCRITMFISTTAVDGVISAGARKHILISQDDRIIFAQAKSESVSLRHCSIRNILSPLYIFGGLYEISDK